MKKNNKGFSLVELIIVIAIMAILVAVLGPQYLKFVERSRKSTDCQNVAEIITALQTYQADPMVDAADRLADTCTVTITGTEADVDASSCSGNADLALIAVGITKVQLKSAEWPSDADATHGASAGDIVITATKNTAGTLDFTSNISSASAADFDIIKGLYE